MSKLLEDLDGQIVLNQADEKTIAEALKIYLSFTRGSRYDKRIQQEIKKVFEEKKSNKSYFANPPRQNDLKPIGFNQMIHILVRRLWDEEDFFRITKNPSQITFISIEIQDLKQASVSLSDVQRFIANQNVFPFITSDLKFFNRSEIDQVRNCQTWIKNGQSIQKFLERIRLVGAYIQTVFFGAQALFEIASDFSALNPSTSGKRKALSETQLNLAAAFAPEPENQSQQEVKPTALEFRIDYPYLVDIILYDIKQIFKQNPNSNIQEVIKFLTIKYKKIFPEVTERHITMIYIVLKETLKAPNKTAEDFEVFFSGLADRLRFTLKEIQTIYYLVSSEKDKTLSQTSISEFVERCIKEDEKGILNDSHIKILRSLFGSLPAELKASQFYSVKEKIKLKIEDPVRKKMVDSLTELITQKIRDIKTKWVLSHLK